MANPHVLLNNLAQAGRVGKTVTTTLSKPEDQPQRARVAVADGKWRSLGANGEGPTQRDARRHAARLLLALLEARLCPTHTRQRFVTLGEAETASFRLSLGQPGTMSAYHCRCGWHHVTEPAPTVDER